MKTWKGKKVAGEKGESVTDRESASANKELVEGKKNFRPCNFKGVGKNGEEPTLTHGRACRERTAQS